MSAADLAWIDRLHVAPAARSILRALVERVVDGQCQIGLVELSTVAGVSKRTAIRALPQLADLGLVRREGGERKINTFRVLVAGDTEARAAIECHQGADDVDEELDPDADPKGAEYMPIADVEGAWRDRLIFAYRNNTGLPRWRDAGRCIVEAAIPSTTPDDVRAELARAGVTS